PARAPPHRVGPRTPPTPRAGCTGPSRRQPRRSVLTRSPGTFADQRRRDHVTGHAHRAQQPVQTEPGRPRLVAGPQPTGIAEPVDQPPYRRLIIEDHLGVGNPLLPPQNPHRDLVFADVPSQMDRTDRLHDTVHDGRLLPVVAPSRSKDGTTHERSPTGAAAASRPFHAD